ncbi:biliverdin-producing heme oxygenase [Moraxella canis]|uniref:Biliverdin-producing heme oxygenase n=1 Tax=Moraxella canis TaxID=90239 RepID=A0ABZ0WXZ0_9GAMM|nr:biliverdin-producing heme oxygenase [Moraxella canis]WQE03944.1 biliverdin-producing heme oxygenase [Moraxella canis]
MTTSNFAERLKEETRKTHDIVDQMVMSVKPFDSVENYIKFLNLQSVFHHIVDDIYKNPALNQAIPNLASMARHEAVLTDLSDLKQSAYHFDGTLPKPTDAKAIGWLYCAEGSNIGAAFLFKDAKEKLGFDENFGAHHLDAHPDGRGKHWKAFRESLNALNLSTEDQDAAIEGALEAFEFYKVALKQIFGEATPSA